MEYIKYSELFFLKMKIIIHIKVPKYLSLKTNLLGHQCMDHSYYDKGSYPLFPLLCNLDALPV